MSRPGSDEAPTRTTGSRPQERTTTADSVRAVPHHKALQTLRAELGLRGFEVRVVGESIIVHRWGLLRVLADFDALKRFAAQVGVTL